MTHQLQILMVEDSAADADLLLWEIRRGGYTPVHTLVDTEESMRAALTRQPWDIVLSNYMLPHFNALAALHLTKQHDPDLPFIIASSDIGEEIAVEAMRAGAQDYVLKSNPSRLLPAIERELRERIVRRAGRQAQRELEENEARLRTIVSNIPGVVFQLRQNAEGGCHFVYVSEGSYLLLELDPQSLQRDSSLFFDLLLDKRSVVLDLIAQAAVNGSPISWEGRIKTASGMLKWIGMRLSPRTLSDGGIQWEGIMQNISRAKQAEIEIIRSRQRLSELSSHLQKAKEYERIRIAREVHDDIGGNLTAIKIDLLWLLKRAQPERPEVVEKLNSLELLVDNTMEIASRIAHDLRPPLLDQGLLAAIEWEASEFQKRMEIPCVVRCANEDVPAESEICHALFSIFRETLTNIAKHSGATRVEVDISTDRDSIMMRVSDNGRGVTNEDLRKRDSFGLKGMRERARHLGGDIRYEGVASAGTTVWIMLPFVPLNQSTFNFELTETP